MLDPEASCISSYTRFLKRERRRAGHQNPSLAILQTAFSLRCFCPQLEPQWWGWTGKPTSLDSPWTKELFFSTCQAVLLLSILGCFWEWPPSFRPREKVNNGQQDTLIQAEFGIWFTYQERQSKLLFASLPKMRPENLRVLSATQRGETQGN